MAKKKKGELTYFLDHPQIKRHKSPGNGNSPGFFGQLAAGKLSNPSGGSRPKAEPKAQSARPASSGSASKPKASGQSSWQKAFSKGFKG